MGEQQWAPRHIRWGWLHIELHLGWRHRLTVTVPMAFLGVFDSLIGLLTLGFVQPGMALAWGFRASLYNFRQAREKAGA